MVGANTYGDERVLYYCTFCGGKTGTRDHCPSKVLLDQPYPNDLPVVPACDTCNSSFSADEEYLACLVSCVLSGTTNPESISRLKVQKILQRSPALRSRIERGRGETSDGIVFEPEHERLESVVTKLAQGHALYELHEPCLRRPAVVRITPYPLMSDTERLIFERPSPAPLFPEVGSRSMQRFLVSEGALCAPWVEVQRGTYRYHASPDDTVSIRIVIQDYLACYIHWNAV